MAQAIGQSIPGTFPIRVMSRIRLPYGALAMDAIGKAMSLENLVEGLLELQRKSDEVDRLTSHHPELSGDILQVVNRMFLTLGTAKVVSLLAKYLELTMDDLASLQRSQ